MTEQLQRAIEALQQLPASAQNTIATRILEEFEEQEWDAIEAYQLFRANPYCPHSYTQT